MRCSLRLEEATSELAKKADLQKHAEDPYEHQEQYARLAEAQIGAQVDLARSISEYEQQRAPLHSMLFTALTRATRLFLAKNKLFPQPEPSASEPPLQDLIEHLNGLALEGVPVFADRNALGDWLQGLEFKMPYWPFLEVKRIPCYYEGQACELVLTAHGFLHLRRQEGSSHKLKAKGCSVTLLEDGSLELTRLKGGLFGLGKKESLQLRLRDEDRVEELA